VIRSGKLGRMLMTFLSGYPVIINMTWIMSVMTIVTLETISTLITGWVKTGISLIIHGLTRKLEVEQLNIRLAEFVAYLEDKAIHWEVWT
jgi:hypothetical protein